MLFHNPTTKPYDQLVCHSWDILCEFHHVVLVITNFYFFLFFYNKYFSGKSLEYVVNYINKEEGSFHFSIYVMLITHPSE